MLLEVVSSFRADFTDASQSSANTSALTRGKTCSEECAKKPADEQQQMHCCAEGLVCDRTTKTCELEIGSTCHGGFRKFFGFEKNGAAGRTGDRMWRAAKMAGVASRVFRLRKAGPADLMKKSTAHPSRMLPNAAVAGNSNGP